jgi:hypothetical protein
VLDEKRAGVMRFAAQKALPLDRRRVEQLTIDQISGLGDAAREGDISAFAHAAQALGLTGGGSEEAPPPALAEPQPQQRGRGRPRRSEAAPPPAETTTPAAEEERRTEPDRDPPPPRGRGVTFEV